MPRRSTILALGVFLLAAVGVCASALAPRAHRKPLAPVAEVETAAEPEPSDSAPPSAAIPSSPDVALRAAAVAIQSAMAAPAASLDEASLMAELREMRQSDPELSLRLARDGNTRFPGSADAAERASIVVKSLMRMGRGDEARAEARAMVDAYPETPWAADVKHHMLDIPSYVPDAGGR
jgi:hypothetical protein